MANLLRKHLVIASCFLVISLSGCGDIDSDLTGLTISPSSATIGIDQYYSFTVVARNTVGTIVSVSPSWSVTGGIGAVTSGGRFTAGSTLGEGSVVASYGGKSASATVTVTDTCWIEGRVTGERDSGGVENVLVSIREDPTLFDRTDSDGDYSISNITAGTYEVYTQENHQIYVSVSQEVTVASGETDDTVNFYLTARSGLPDPLEPIELP